ncbi:Crp/Fnr family transcriptional regulator [Spirosoma endophyticum]|uniref:cAMP-binding domain of CRP or a regulatory subunit of cAMP-dependent protein kinases n=1 Tax=Spirosoma endophyticum TaxID=662367 RepID=A0A1I2DWS9_9BACT|nr:Crp/Fnr family transcriptional regulator [Spirosoma endophyticum]SFE84937.1 cAMP-binding domain of CRP or a regulatory subunit of cAMP-dependent protein kinases [Spirosoma endophyticum]
MISATLLEQYGAIQCQLPKAVLLFSEGEEAQFYYQIISGAIKMVNFGDGKEFVQGIFEDGQSFGEPPFLARKPYPASAMTTRPTSLWRCNRSPFSQLLADHFDVHWQITQTLSERLVNKARLLERVAIEHAEERLLHYIDQLKNGQPIPVGQYAVPYTRQQLADLLGLRVETVIRTVKRLEQRGELTIRLGKIWR